MGYSAESVESLKQHSGAREVFTNELTIDRNVELQDSRTQILEDFGTNGAMMEPPDGPESVQTHRLLQWFRLSGSKPQVSVQDLDNSLWL